MRVFSMHLKAAVLVVLLTILTVPCANSVGGGKKKGGQGGVASKGKGGGGGGGKGKAAAGSGGGGGGGGGRAKAIEAEGFAAMEKGNFELCIQKFTKATQMDPEFADYHTQVGSDPRHHSAAAAALPNARHASSPCLSLSPGFYTYLFVQPCCGTRAIGPGTGDGELIRAPLHFIPSTQLATCLRSVGRRQEAIAEFEEARKHMEKERNKVGGDQYWASVHINLGYMYAEGGGSGPGMVKAAEIFRKVMQPCPLLHHHHRTFWGGLRSAPHDAPFQMSRARRCD